VKKLSIFIYCAIAAIFLASCSKSVSPGPSLVPTNPTGPTAPVDSGWSFQTTPSFSDEFSYTGTPDTTKWGYDLGGGGWGNQELETYTDSLSNVYVSNGLLHITALKTIIGSSLYTSARMVSKNAGSLRYGRIEAYAKLPASPKGSWPAIWMLPNTYAYGAWPNSGEIDIMEQVSFDPLNVHFSLHNSLNYGGNSHTETTNIPTDTSAFHKYRIDWTPYAVRGYYDDVEIFTFVNPGTGSNQWPFDQPFHLLMNIAIGGSWGGSQGVDGNVCPATMLVDYVRFYQMIHK
jgi:beta-glucanase (GH16 family)